MRALILPDGASLPALTPLVKQAQAQQQTRAGDQTLKLHTSLYAGKLWDNGLGWSGPRPDPAGDRTHGQSTKVLLEIERSFVGRNLIRDIVNRHQSGVAGREPLYNVVYRDGRKATEAQKKVLAEYVSALTDWWEHSSIWPAIQATVRTALVTGSGTLRLYLHQSQLDVLSQVEGRPVLGIRSGLSLSEAARRVSAHAPAWDQAGVTRDRDGHANGAYHTYQVEGQARLELQERIPGGVRVHPDVSQNGTDLRDPTDYPVPEGLIYELRLDPLVTESIRRLMLAANKTLTMGSRNIDLGGFVETTILNGQMPGEWKDDPNEPGKKVFVPGTYNRGAGVANFIAGIPQMVMGEHGKPVPTGILNTPSINYREPSPYDTFDQSYSQLREAILDEANQLHVMITGDASASGVSRQQAVNDFLSSLEPTRMALEGLLRWVLDAVLRLALHFTGRIAEIDELRIQTQAKISAVQPTPAEVETALKLHSGGAIGEEDFLRRIGVEDVEAHRATRTAEGITPALAFRIVDSAPAPWVGMRALMLAFPGLGLTEEDVRAQRDADLSGPTGPADLSGDDPDADPDAQQVGA